MNMFDDISIRPHPLKVVTLGLFYYLVYGSADPILEGEKINLVVLIFFFFTHFKLSVTSPDKGGRQINYGVHGSQEPEPTYIAREETRHGDRMIY